MKISITYSTNRKEPKFFEWFLPSLLNQITEEEKKNIEIILVSYDNIFVTYDNEVMPSFEFNGITIFQTYPKPNLYQYEIRRTKTEMFSTANARNTGFILSSGEYVVFVDDLSILMSGWWEAVKQSASKKRIVCGAYQKHTDMVVENGTLISSNCKPCDIDSRWSMGNSHPVLISGGALFGCSLGIPAKDLIEINGFDEICDSIGGEDYHLGVRLNHAGKRVYYDRRMLTYEAGDLHDQPFLMLREDRTLEPEEYMTRLKSYGVNKRHHSGNWDSSHMIIDLLYGTKQIKSLRNNYDIGERRESKTFPEPFPDDRHWFDRKLLSEI